MAPASQREERFDFITGEGYLLIILDERKEDVSGKLGRSTRRHLFTNEARRRCYGTEAARDHAL